MLIQGLKRSYLLGTIKSRYQPYFSINIQCALQEIFIRARCEAEKLYIFFFKRFKVVKMNHKVKAHQ